MNKFIALIPVLALFGYVAEAGKSTSIRFAEPVISSQIQSDGSDVADSDPCSTCYPSYAECIATCYDTCGGAACAVECQYGYDLCQWHYCGGQMPEVPILPC